MLLCLLVLSSGVGKGNRERKKKEREREEKVREGKSESVDSKDSTWSSPPVTNIQNKSGEKAVKP